MKTSSKAVINFLKYAIKSYYTAEFELDHHAKVFPNQLVIVDETGKQQFVVTVTRAKRPR